jgi:hypothetical protein
MKHALVVYESMFGNTQTIAVAVADGLSVRMTVDLVEVGAAPSAVSADVDLLVVGGPTHAFGMTRPNTRQDAAKQAGRPVVSQGVGIREWIEGLAAGSVRVPVATFDSRVRRPRLPGSAAHRAAKRLRGLGARLVLPPESFWVNGTPGPILDGEEERARQWGLRLAAAVASAGGEQRVG